MSVAMLIVLVLLLAVVTACAYELRHLRRGIEALDVGEGRRAAAIVGGLQGLRERVDLLRDGVLAGLEELSPNRRNTVEQRGPLSVRPAPAAGAGSSGLRLDVPRVAEEDRESDGETRLIPRPIAAELLSGKAVCRMCEGSGVVRTGGGAKERCGGCEGTGVIDPADARATVGPGLDERAARLPG